ncbi:hypothetical protein JCM33374_g1629 [Metschnikowia sp. JCM 33374]|nr:hypothetical protein JCM33374_g1629 [Metschnikowia sp. JCM 33374]
MNRSSKTTPSQPVYHEKRGITGYVGMDDAKKDIASLVKDLQSFLTGNKFEFRSFEARFPGLRAHLADIEFNFDNEPRTVNLRREFLFAKNMFSVMTDASDKMSRYARSVFSGAAFVNQAIEVNVLAFTLQNAQGALDLSVDWYEDRVAALYRRLRLCEEEYTRLNGLDSRSPSSSGLRWVFASRSAEATRTLSTLMRQFPRVS